MQKILLCFVISLLLLQAAKAEKPDTLMVYLKNSGQKVVNKDSADFYRIILAPDSNIDKELYRVYDYYPNGKPKAVATSLTKDIQLKLDGVCINYFQNGKRSSEIRFKNGIPVGSITNYYPNGKVYEIFKVEDLSNGYNRYSNYNYLLHISELRDSTGNILATNGTGHVLIFDSEFKNVIQEGNINNFKKEGDWRGKIADSGSYICTFHKDELKSGISYMKSGNHYTFKQAEVKAVYSDGNLMFYQFIKKNLQYPESAKKRKVNGTVIVEFYVETSGAISDVAVKRGVMKSLDDEAVRVVSLSPPWIPASRFGIPFRTYQTVSVDFYD